ncbi:MAG: methylated-DNA--[protein]-cysteine S-methyltransferase [Acidimicrobiia bacterium]|nr:methylated-DNA--[protein]-cysteine S-methyltransferase [Acidimicrobiia bacterium]
MNRRAGRFDGAALFYTAIGGCGVAWRGDAVAAVQIPERSRSETLRRLTGGFPALVDHPVPRAIGEAIDAMVALLDGDDVDLRPIEVDVGSPAPFDEAVWGVTRSIPRGSSLTYGQVAERIGQPGAAQAVGRSLGANPCPIVIPCHRVLGADGQLVGFSAHGGVETKRRMLLIEGCPAVPPSLFD